MQNQPQHQEEQITVQHNSPLESSIHFKSHKGMFEKMNYEQEEYESQYLQSEH